MKEIWKDVPGYENCYLVSHNGCVKSIKFNDHVILKNDLVRGYKCVRLSKNGKAKRFLVHQLVAMAFLEHKPCGHKLVVDHIDNDKTNNYFLNLQIISQRDNASKDRKGGVSKYLGVFRDNRDNKWFSSISINNKNKYLGRFNTELEASKAYQKELKTIKNEQ